MRHSDIKLTMGVYIDPRKLDVRGAVEKLPVLPLGLSAAREAEVRLTVGVPVARPVAQTAGRSGPLEAVPGTAGGFSRDGNSRQGDDGSTCSGNEKPPVTTPVITGGQVGPAGFEPTTSCTPSYRPRLRSPTSSGEFPALPFGLHHRLHHFTGCTCEPPPFGRGGRTDQRPHTRGPGYLLAAADPRSTGAERRKLKAFTTCSLLLVLVKARVLS
jgi:hypothetical protein